MEHYKSKPYYYGKKIVVPFRTVREANHVLDMVIINTDKYGFLRIADLYTFAYPDRFELGPDEWRYGWTPEIVKDAVICCLPGNGRCFIEMPKCVLL